MVLGQCILCFKFHSYSKIFVLTILLDSLHREAALGSDGLIATSLASCTMGGTPKKQKIIEIHPQ